MKAPEFWRQGNGGWRAGLLTPFAWLYAAGAALRIAFARPVSVGVPVICVGNVTAGGAGKTPVVLALAAAAQAMGVCMAVVSRGYGGALEGPVKVDLGRHKASDVGDEPLLLARHASTWISKDRVAGARAAVADGAELIVLDDGFQNPRLHKDLSLIVMDAEFGVGNGRVIPAGPLREALPKAMKRADLVLLMGRDNTALRGNLPETPRVEIAELRPIPTETLGPGTRCVAFAGIGLPEKFFATLRAVGVEVLAEHAFPDHFMYTRADLDRLLADAAAKKAVLVTTAKDHVKVPQDLAGHIIVLEVAVHFNRPTLATDLIEQVLKNG